MAQFFVERKLLYSLKNESERHEFSVRIMPPRYLVEGEKFFEPGAETAVCSIEFDGIDGQNDKTYGADLLQALELSVNSVEPMLRRLSKKYDLYFPSGEPYFEDD
ncbi:hypothetical protein [uncultured Sneathiella sp.]|jgi:hypothetical protein|uniref:hypothetical protein n=1 Tax=uncultured Sneathiella sp. TaxID=879315 RepID=UPI0030D7C5DE|tara:strand:+ start:1036 stop:1350 length:315 start_codon:yes stop_codon:yes gene_type:complete